MNWLKLGNEMLNFFRNTSIATTVKYFLYAKDYGKMYIPPSFLLRWSYKSMHTVYKIFARILSLLTNEAQYLATR